MFDNKNLDYMDWANLGNWGSRKKTSKIVKYSSRSFAGVGSTAKNKNSDSAL